MDGNSIMKILYKKDALTDELRISKTRIISLLIFVLSFIFMLWAIFVEWGFLIIDDIIGSLIIALIITVPVFIVGWIISYIIDNNARKTRMQIENQQQSNDVRQKPKKQSNKKEDNDGQKETRSNINAINTGNKKCPNCGKVIKKQALRCKYCNYYFKEGKVMPKSSKPKQSDKKVNNQNIAPSSSKSTWTVIDEYAHYANYTLEVSNEEELLKNDLLSRGSEAVDIIVDYLIKCGVGHPSIESYWWNNAKGLVRLIKEYPNVDYESKYKKLINLNTNIWEYHTQVIQIAQEEFQLLKENQYNSTTPTNDGGDKNVAGEEKVKITEEKESGGLSQLLNNDEQSFCMKVSNKYSDRGGIFFEGDIDHGRINFGDIVYVYGKNGKLKYKDVRVLLIQASGIDKTSLSASESKYAALLLAGLDNYGDLEYGDIISTKKLDLEVVEEEVEETKELPTPKTYNHPEKRIHVKMATDDLREICQSNALQSKVDWVKNVGQDLYDAHGFTAMQEVFINVKTTHPQCQLALSAIWDGVGGWAD